MSVVRKPRYSMEEVALRGNSIYERDIRDRVEPAHRGDFVAVDIETGEWTVSADALEACDNLIARLPDCQTWLIQVGCPYVHRMGRHGNRTAQR